MQFCSHAVVQSCSQVKKITEAPELKINLNFDSDTLYIPINYNTTVEYSSTDPLVRYASFFLNGNQLAISGATGFFYIQYDNSKYQINVPYILKVSFFRSTGSGSLADKLESEGFLYSREIVVYFVNEDTMLPKITSVINEKGRLKITWERYSGFGFKNYYVRLPEVVNIAIISDQNITSCYPAVSPHPSLSPSLTLPSLTLPLTLHQLNGLTIQVNTN